MSEEIKITSFLNQEPFSKTEVLLGSSTVNECLYKLFLDNLPKNDFRVNQNYEIKTLRAKGLSLLKKEILKSLETNISKDDIFNLDLYSFENKKYKQNLTLKAMQDKIPIIWNPYFEPDEDNNRIGSPSFLIRVNKWGKAQNTYIPVNITAGSVVKIDTKRLNSRRTKMKPISFLDSPYFELRQLTYRAVKVQKSSIFQLIHQWKILENLGHAFRMNGSIPVGVIGIEKIIAWEDLSPFMDEYEDRFSKSVHAVTLARQNFPASVARVNPVWISSCGQCDWKSNCRKELEAKDDISLIVRSRAKNYLDFGIKTISQLASLNRKAAYILSMKINIDSLVLKSNDQVLSSCVPISVLVSNIKEVTILHSVGIYSLKDLLDIRKYIDELLPLKSKNLSRDIELAKLYKLEKLSSMPILVRSSSYPNDFCIPKADVEIDIDLEDTGRQVYLWGALVNFTSEIPSTFGFSSGYFPFVTFGCKDLEEGNFQQSQYQEAKNFENFWKWLKKIISSAIEEGLTWNCYYYSPAENKWLRSCARRFQSNPWGLEIPSIEEVDDFISSPNWIDIYSDFIYSKFISLSGLGLKSMAKFAGFKWRNDSMGGEESRLWYQKAIQDRDFVVSQENKKRILAYNEDDVRATFILRNWLNTESKSLLSILDL